MFKLSLHRSLAEASELAERNFRQIKARRDKLTDDFRQKIILSSIEFENTSNNITEYFPALDEKFFQTKEQIKQTLMTLGLLEKEIAKSLDPFFKKLEELSKVLPSNEKVIDFIGNEKLIANKKQSKKTEKRGSQKAHSLCGLDGE